MTTLKVWNGTDWEYLTGGAAILQQDAEPGTPVEGDLWIDTDAPSGSTHAQQEGPDGATRASTTLGPLSTPWTCSITVASGQVVDIMAQVALMDTNNVTMFIAFRRGSTTIYEAAFYTGSNPAQVTNCMTHFWRDVSPGTGSVTYEIYVANNDGSTLTLQNGATLDTTKSLTQGKSMLALTAL